MEVRPWPSRAAAQDLSKAERFALAGLTVDPPTRRIIAGDREELLEPRVMRVLVALDLARSKVLSRDDLIELCWDGVIVGDNAINRVISRLRAVLAELAGDTVRLETITKVGFRLVEENIAPTPAPSVAWIESLPTSQSVVSRRTAIGGALGVLALGTIAYAGWRNAPSRYRPNPEALELYERGVGISKSATPGHSRQALTFFKRAVAIDPEFADAWGALAIGYTYDDPVYPQQIESAARRALALDPDQADARLSLIVGPPFYRRWHLVEPKLRQYLRRFPDHWYGNFQMGWLLRDVGRADAALPFARRAVEIDPLIASGWSFLGATLAAAGRSQESDAAIEEGFRRWPGHAELWLTRYAVFMHSQRFSEAVAFARNSDNHPAYFGEMSEIYGGLAESLARRDADGIAAGRAYMRGVLSKDEPGSLEVIPRLGPLLALIDARDDALTAFEAYFFGGDLFGRSVAAPSNIDTRFTRPLFTPPLLARRDARFNRLLIRTGLEDYWKRSGSQPDFRRN